MARYNKEKKYYYDGREVEVVNKFLDSNNLTAWRDVLRESYLNFENVFIHSGLASGVAKGLVIVADDNTSRCEVAYWYTYNEANDEVEVNGFIVENTYSEEDISFLAKVLEDDVTTEECWELLLKKAAEYRDSYVTFYSQYYADRILAQMDVLNLMRNVFDVLNNAKVGR